MLVSKTTPTRFEHPHEAGQFARLRPPSWEEQATFAEFDFKDDRATINETLAGCIRDWSYTEGEVTADYVADLDTLSLQWIVESLLTLVPAVPEGEGEESSPGSASPSTPSNPEGDSLPTLLPSQSATG